MGGGRGGGLTGLGNPRGREGLRGGELGEELSRKLRRKSGVGKWAGGRSGLTDGDLVRTGLVPPFAWKVSPQRPGRAFRSLVIQQTLAARSELDAGQGPGRGGELV